MLHFGQSVSIIVGGSHNPEVGPHPRGDSLVAGPVETIWPREPKRKRFQKDGRNALAKRRGSDVPV